MTTEQDERTWAAAQREQMHRHLARAADQFGVVLAGRPVDGLHHRSTSVRVTAPEGPAWLRVGREYLRWVHDPDVADFWTGIPDSAALIGVPRPRVLASAEWDDPDGERRVRADLVTLMPGRPCSPTDALRVPLDLPDTWRAGLRRGVEIIGATPTTRYASSRGRASKRVETVFGRAAAEAFRPVEFETTHGDLHWANLVGPEFGVLDWELWGLGPAGIDAATVFLFSLLVPEVSGRVASLFGNVLGSPAGHVSQVCVASRILARADDRENPDLAAAVRAHIGPILSSRRRNH